MEFMLATREGELLVKLTKEVRSRGLSGEHGTWEEFLKFIDPERAEAYSSPTSRADPTLLRFLTSLNKKEDLRLVASLLNPSHPLVAKYARIYEYEPPEQGLVRMTLTHDEYPFDFMIPYNPKDWVLTSEMESPPFSPVPYRPKVPFDVSKTDMIAICCEKVLCSDNTEGAVRVAAVDRNLKVVFDALVEPDQPVINYRTSITGLDRFTLAQRNASPLADIQDKLLELFHMKTIMVGHCLNRDLKALKMVHARLIDTSLVFNYDLPAAAACVLEKLPRPSLDQLCKSVLRYKIKKTPGRCVHEAEATMKLVLAILRRGVQTSVPLPCELAILVDGLNTSVQPSPILVDVPSTSVQLPPTLVDGANNSVKQPPILVDGASTSAPGANTSVQPSPILVDGASTSVQLPPPVLVDGATTSAPGSNISVQPSPASATPVEKNSFPMMTPHATPSPVECKPSSWKAIFSRYKSKKK